MAVAGVMAGLAAGVKITAVPMLFVAVPLAAAAAGGLPWRRWLAASAAFGVMAVIVVSPWLVRTAVWTGGNPVWPVGMSTLGTGGFSPGQVERFRVAHSPTDRERSVAAGVGVLDRDVLFHWQYGYVLLPAGVVAMGLRWRDRQTRALLVTAAVVVVVWFGFTHLLARFLVMVIPVAAVAVGRAAMGRASTGQASIGRASIGRRRPAGVVGVAVAVAVAAAAAGWAGVWPRLAEWSGTERGQLVFGPTDFGPLIADAPALADAVAGGKHIALVGDAQAFFYQVPMDRLRYRTVFDLPADGSDAVTAWAGRGVAGHAGWLLVVNPAEIARLHGTYVATPPLPAAWAGRGTFLLQSEDLNTEARRHGEEKQRRE